MGQIRCKQRLTIMEIKFEMCDHNLDNLLRVFSESFLQFSRITDQHLTGRRLLLQTCRPDPETLLERRRKHSEISRMGHQSNATCLISIVFNRWQIIQQMDSILSTYSEGILPDGQKITRTKIHFSRINNQIMFAIHPKRSTKMFNPDHHECRHSQSKGVPPNVQPRPS